MVLAPDVHARPPADTLTSAELVRLMTVMKLAMMRNGLGRSVGRTIGFVLGGLWALGAVGVAVFALGALRWQDAGLAADATTAALAALTVAWALLPLLVFGVDETLDPARFVLLPLRAGELLPGLLVAGLVGVPGLATAFVAAGTVATWTRGVLPIIAAVLGAVLGVLTCLLIARVLTSGFARFLRSRRFRDFATALLAVGMGSLGLGINIAAGSMSGQVHSADELRGQLHRVAEIAGATPFGWAWSLPGLVANDRWALAGLHLVLALALVAGLGWAWERLLARNLTTPADLGGGGAKVRGATSLVDRLYPATPTGAIAGRCVRYWRRDPRYLSSVAATLVVPALFLVSQSVGPSSNPTVAAFAPLIIAVVLSMSLSQDTAYDGSALWLHISCGAPGSADRAGRVLALFTWALPILALSVPATLAWTHRWSLWPIIVGLSVALIAAGTGVASVVSARWLRPAPPAGGNPFASSGGSGVGSLVAVLLNTTATGLLVLPTVALAVASVWISWLAWAALGVGVVTGIVVLVAGIRIGGRLLDRRWPEVLSAISAPQ